MKTVEDMYNVTKDTIPLLSNYDAPFWKEYRDNYQKYDALFRRLYKSYRYFLQEKNDSDVQVAINFTTDVYNHLLVNDKKYTELFRINTITDEDYSIIDNYRIVETKNTEGSNTINTTLGARTDTENDSATTKVSPYENENFYNENLVNNNNSFTKGTQSDSSLGTNEEEYILSRKGNIGVQTGTDMLRKHNDYWNGYKFYLAIFNDICAELLLV